MDQDAEMIGLGSTVAGHPLVGLHLFNVRGRNVGHQEGNCVEKRRSEESGGPRIVLVLALRDQKNNASVTKMRRDDRAN